MAKYSPISGFPEWTPGQKMLEQELMATLSRQFELAGFAPIETRAVEPLSVLTNKGDDKEIYLLSRLQDAVDGTDNKSKSEKEALGLHFDLTVPFARYVVEHQHVLNFPFKRYQIQKVWRGERPQEGRYREFYQCDIDVVGAQTLDVTADAEMASVMLKALRSLPVPEVVLKINNRKALQGFYQGLGIDRLTDTLRIVDKLAKIGPDGVSDLLRSELALNDESVQLILDLASLRGGVEVLEQAKQLGVEHPLLSEGLKELETVMAMTGHLNGVEVDFSIARGLDYYTGTVYEGVLLGHEHIGAVCSGGRYEDLASGGKVPYPGVGASIGLTRLLGYLFGRELLEVQSHSPVQVMVLLNDGDARQAAFAAAERLRNRGISTDVYHVAQSYGKQLKGIQKRQIPYALFVEDSGFSVKALSTGVQETIDIQTWEPEQLPRVRFKARYSKDDKEMEINCGRV